MAALPNPTTDKIYQAYFDAQAKESTRGYLGCSELGEECSRRLWYSFRNVSVPVFDGRILRLFETGKREEARVIDDLRAAGFTIYDKDASGRQFRFSACNGHLSGGLDGVIEGLQESSKPHVLEIKTHNQKSFDSLQKDGVEKSKPVHFAQCQLYMGLAELERTLYVAVNKNTDEIYIERLRFDKKVFKALLLKAERIINAESAPDRLSEDPSFYLCRWCPYSDNCHGEKMPDVGCRTCEHSRIVTNGLWGCAMERKWPCDGHIFIPSLFHWAEPIDGDPTFIRYKIKSTGREFLNVADVGFPALDLPHYSSQELHNCKVAAIGHPAVEAARTILEGKVIA